MRNILQNYPQPSTPRYLELNFRNFNDRVTASHRDEKFYNGTKSTGYGGFSYDGRWKQVAQNCVDLYNLKTKSNVLHINCDFGFLLNDIKGLNNSFNIFGTETSKYAIEQSMKSVRRSIKLTKPLLIDYPDNFFDLTIALGVVYTLTLPDAILLLKLISRISKNNNSFITLATYETKEEKDLFESWTLGGNLCLKREEWNILFKESGYKGDYLFIDSNYLNLKFKK